MTIKSFVYENPADDAITFLPSGEIEGYLVNGEMEKRHDLIGALKDLDVDYEIIFLEEGMFVYLREGDVNREMGKMAMEPFANPEPSLTNDESSLLS